MNGNICAALMIAMFCPAMHAGAASYCVDTAAELQSALTAAAASTVDDIIRIESGTYVSTSAQGFRAELSVTGDLEISGGWFAGCLFRQRGVRSVIDGGLVRPGMTLLGTFDSGGLLRVAHLSFVRGVGSDAGGLTANPFVATNLDVEIEDCNFRDNTAVGATEGFGGGLIAVSDGSLSVKGNVFALNHGDAGAGAASLRCGSGLGAFVNNTVVDNTADVGAAGDSGGVHLNGNCVWEVANNILWGNEGLDLMLFAQDAVLRYNDLDDLGGPEPPASSQGNINVDPQFVSATNFRLERSSPLVDAGLDAPLAGLPAFSHDGGPRIAGPAVDIGAYELDVLFADDFDPLIIGR